MFTNVILVEPRDDPEAGGEEEEPDLQAPRGLPLRYLPIQGKDEISSQVRDDTILTFISVVSNLKRKCNKKNQILSKYVTDINGKNLSICCYFRAHRQSVHEGIKYPCDQCEYKATAMGSLRRHYNAIHSGHKYPCSECEHVSNTPANLKYHHNTVHMGLRKENIGYTRK